MFLLLSKYLKPLDEVERLMTEHRAFLDRFYREGKVVFSGPREPLRECRRAQAEPAGGQQQAARDEAAGQEKQRPRHRAAPVAVRRGSAMRPSRRISR